MHRPDPPTNLTLLTGIWYMPAWSEAACGVSKTRISVPTSITRHQSIKCPGSPQRQQAGPDLTAALGAGSGSSDWRGESGGMGTDEVLELADPAPLARGCALGGRFTRDLGTGLEVKEGGRERETEGRVSPTPWHATIWSSASWMARSSNVGRWHWTHCTVFFGNRAMNCSSTTRSMIWFGVASPGQHPSVARVPELLSHHEGSAVFPQLQRSEPQMVLFGVQADPLEDGSFEVVVDQEFLNWQLLCSHLCLPRKQRNETHWPVRPGPTTCLRGPLKEVDEGLRIILRAHLVQRHVGRAGAGGIPPARTSRSIQLRKSLRSSCCV